MSLNVTLNGSVYIIPETNEVGWGGNTTSYLVAIPAGVLQKTGGSFTLSAETDFGASFGLKSLYYKSRSANIAAAGILRLNNNSDAINWRNAANSADLSLIVNASNLLSFNGSTVYTIGAGTITNADIAAGAGIVYSKLNLSNSIVNADVNTSAAIAYSKLNLATSIVNADVSPSAAIVYSKLSLSNSIVNADVNTAAAIAYSKLNLSNSILNADINTAAAIAFSKMAALTANQMLTSNASGVVSASGWNFDANSNLLTGPNDEIQFRDTTGGEYVALRAPAAVTTHAYELPIAPGTAGQVLSWQTGGQLTWINAAGGGTINTGTAGFFSYYPATGTTLDDQTVLSTNGTTQVYIIGGTTSVPSLAFATDTDTGLYNNAVNGWSLVGGGVDTLYYNGSSEIVVNTTLNILGTAKFIDGSFSAPSLTFASDLNTGFYRPSADAIAVTTGGGLKWTFTAIGGITATGTDGNIATSDGTALLPSHTFVNDTDTGLYLITSNAMGLTVAGGVRVELYSTSMTMNVPVFGIGGTAASPSLTFTLDPNTGIWNPAADTLGIATAGVDRLRINTDFFPTDDATTSNGKSGNRWSNVISAKFSVSDGTAAAPSYTFINDTDIGIYRIGANEIGFSTNGVLTASLSTAALSVEGSARMFVPNGTAALPSYSFGSDQDTGIFREAANTIAFSTNGVREWNIGAGGDFTNVTSTGHILTGTGSAASPSYALNDDPDTGLYRVTTNVLGVSAGGSNVATFATTGVAIRGTTTNDAASAGDYGAYISSYATGVAAAATATYGNITSISLTAGDWDVTGMIQSDVSTVVTRFLGAVSAFSGNTTTDHVAGDNVSDGFLPTGGSNGNTVIAAWRVSLASTTTIYVKARLTYASGSPTLTARISARRVR